MSTKSTHKLAFEGAGSTSLTASALFPIDCSSSRKNTRAQHYHFPPLPTTRDLTWTRNGGNPGCIRAPVGWHAERVRDACPRPQFCRALFRRTGAGDTEG